MTDITTDPPEKPLAKIEFEKLLLSLQEALRTLRGIETEYVPAVFMTSSHSGFSFGPRWTNPQLLKRESDHDYAQNISVQQLREQFIGRRKQAPRFQARVHGRHDASQYRRKDDGTWRIDDMLEDILGNEQRCIEARRVAGVRNENALVVEALVAELNLGPYVLSPTESTEKPVMVSLPKITATPERMREIVRFMQSIGVLETKERA